MIINRNINGINIAVDIHKRANLYFSKSFASKVNNVALDQILDSIYEANKRFLPLALTWEITSICNFGCPFCYINTCGQQKNSISFSRIKKDIDVLVDRGLLICYITGGEALLHPNFIDIYSYLKRKGVLVAVITNLSLLSEEHLELFKLLPPYKITVSLYGCSDESFKKATRNTDISCETIFLNIIRLKEAGLNVNCQTPINSFTIDDYIGLAKWCEQHDIKYTCSNELNPTYRGESLDQYYVSSERFSQYRNKVNRVNTLKSKEIPIPAVEAKYKNHFDCKAGKHTFVISHDYKMRPCFIMYREGAAIFPITEDISKSLDEMIEYLECWKKKHIKYCKGCLAKDFCNECMYTQGNQANLKEYMLEICRNNLLLMKTVHHSTEE